MPSFDGLARARMPRPEAFSERKSSSMMMTGKLKRMIQKTVQASQQQNATESVQGCLGSAVLPWLMKILIQILAGPPPAPDIFHPILVRRLADFVGLEEEHLGAAPRRQ